MVQSQLITNLGIKFLTVTPSKHADRIVLMDMYQDLNNAMMGIQ